MPRYFYFRMMIHELLFDSLFDIDAVIYHDGWEEIFFFLKITNLLPD